MLIRCRGRGFRGDVSRSNRTFLLQNTVRYSSSAIRGNSLLIGPRVSELAPQLAPVAIQSGKHAARQLLAAHRGSGAEPFTYKDRGMMATIGRRIAVAEIRGPAPLGGVSLTGTIGWLAWLFLHPVTLMGVRNRVAVLVNWMWRYLGWPAGPQVIVEDDPPFDSPFPSSAPSPGEKTRTSSDREP